MYNLRWWIVASWSVILLGMGWFALQTSDLLKDNGFTPHGSESHEGMERLGEELGLPTNAITIVYESESIDLTTEQSKEQIMASLEEVIQLPYVESVDWLSAQRQEGSSYVQAIQVPLNLDTDASLQVYPEFITLIPEPEGMQVHVTGGTPVLYDMQQASKNDIIKAEMIGIPIALVVLLAIFGTVVAAMLPMIVGVTSVTVTLGLTYFIAQEMSLSNFLPNIVTMLGLAVGIDYALFMVSRFREELRKQPSVRDAVAMTSQTAGQSIFFSGIAVLIGLVGMLFIDLNIFQSLCIGGVLVVSVSVLVANTLLIALMGILGDRVNRLRVFPTRAQRESGFWSRVAYGVMKRPVTLVLVLLLALGYLMSPLSGMILGVPNAEVLPPSYESRSGYDLMNETYKPNQLSPIQVFIESEAPYTEPQTIEAVRQLMDKVAAWEQTEKVTTYLSALGPEATGQEQVVLQQESVRQQLEAQGLAADRAAMAVVTSKYGPDEPESEVLVEQLRSLTVEGLELTVTGDTAYRMDIIDRIYDGLPMVVGFVLVVTFLVLMWAFRSIVLPLKAVLMNVFSLGASMGVVVFVFQHGYFAELLQITSTGYVNATLPVIIFCVVFGISMDYEVFLISRIMEEYEATGDNEHSTAEGLIKTGSLITSAALILIVVVGTFIFTDIEIMKALGLGLALAVLLDATVIRIILVPALMKLMGRANWWWPFGPSREAARKEPTGS